MKQRVGFWCACLFLLSTRLDAGQTYQDGIRGQVRDQQSVIPGVEVMKTINPAFAALRTAVQESKADGVTQNLAALKPAFNQAETLWDDLGQSAAADWARDALAHSASIERAAAAGNWEAAKASAGALNTVCQNCHGVYRDRLDDGTFRIRAGSF